MNPLSYILQDYRRNRGNWKILIVLTMFRIAQLISKGRKWVFVLLAPYLILYRILVEWVLNIELHWNLNVGSGLRIFHGGCLVVHPNTKIGNNVTLRQCTTIGAKEGETCAPNIGNNVNIGPNSVLLGSIKIGDNAIIGASSLVISDVPVGGVYGGNPARDLRKSK